MRIKYFKNKAFQGFALFFWLFNLQFIVDVDDILFF